jgi:hypothetical protein
MAVAAPRLSAQPKPSSRHSLTSHDSRLSDGYFPFKGLLFVLLFGLAILALGIICSIVTSQMAFVEKRITKTEGIIGSIASVVCIALNILLLADGDALSVPIAIATLFVMVNIVMTERPVSEQRAQGRLSKIGPLLYSGEKPMEQSFPTENGSEDSDAPQKP